MHLSEGMAAVRSQLAKASVASERLALAGLWAAALLLLFGGLGNRDFWPPDEPRYGAIAEELRSFVHGWRGLVLLHLNGRVYTQKPPLFFWLAALAGTPAGRVSEAAARLPSALAGLATLGLAFWLGRSMFDRRSGAWAALVLLTVPSWLQLATSARLDALLTAFVTLALVAAWRIDREIGAAGRNRLVLHAAIGLGVLTKGPLALLVPALGIAAYLTWERRLDALRRFATVPCALLSVAPGVVWLTASSLLAPPGYVDESFWDNLILRFFSGTAHARPVWFYVEALPRGFLPWTLLWPLAWWRHRALQREADRAPARAWRFLLSSIGAAFVFFSLSAGKRGLYLLPVYPLIAVACGDALAAWSAAAGAPSRRLRPSLFAGIALLVAVGLGSLVCGRAAPIVVPASFGWLLAGGGAVAWLVERTLWWRGAERAALVAGAASGLVGAALAFQTGLQPALNARNSQRPVAEIALRATPPGATIGVYRNETLAAAVGYYARRPVRALREPAELACFLAAGGHTLVVEDVQLGALTEQTPLREVGRGRTRQRQLHVLVRGR